MSKIHVRLNIILIILGCKHGQVDNSWTLHRIKWKWFKLYTNFEFCKEKIINFEKKTKKKHIDLQSQTYDEENDFNKILQILEDGASRWYWTSNYLQFFKYDKIK